MRSFADLTPDDFAATRTAAGRAWIAALPALLADMSRRWDLTVVGEEFRHGYNAVVFPVASRGRPLALKLAWQPDLTAHEAAGLLAWRSRSVVELVAADVPRGVLLLERLDASRSLAAVPLPEAAAIAGALIRDLAIDPQPPRSLSRRCRPAWPASPPPCRNASARSVIRFRPDGSLWPPTLPPPCPGTPSAAAVSSPRSPRRLIEWPRRSFP
jgi:hypothetical protein